MEKTLNPAFKKTLNSFAAMVVREDITTTESVNLSYDSIENTGIVTIETTLPDGTAISIMCALAQFQAASGNMISQHNAEIQKQRQRIAEEQKALSR